MTFSRRKILGLIGGGTVLAVSAAGGMFLTNRTPTNALRPWTLAGQYDDLRMRALSFALLAPNPHNRQPWIAELKGDDTIILYRDAHLNLPETDPLDRQLTIGMGCFIELLTQAVAQENIGMAVSLFPQGTAANAPVAELRLTGTGQPDPLFGQVMQRHTNRSAYDLQRPVSQPNLGVIMATTTPTVRSAASNDPALVATLRGLAIEAMVLETNTPRTHAESIHLTRIGKAEIEANPDGISLGGPLLDSLGALGMLTREAAIDPSSSSFAQVIDVQRKGLQGTPAFFWLATKGNSREEQIATGRAWMRAHLAATALGLSVQPVSQSLQEYAEMVPIRQKIHDLLAKSGETVQMLGRIGFGPAQSPAPRWPLETRLKNA